MKNKIKIDIIIRRFFLIPALAISVCLVCLSGAKMTAHANEQVFNIDVEMLPPDGNTFDIILTVENTGEDWEGTARLMVSGRYSALTDCAYDTALTLPQDSTKQFVVMVPKESIYSTYSTLINEIQVTLLDKNSNVAADKVFENFFDEDVDSLTMGILSDDYLALTYLDMGGLEIDFYSGEYPIRLMEIDKDNLNDSLYALNFLVIDTYNTGILTNGEISNIEEWVDDGGVLIIGTGSYAEDTLRGFDYLGIECKKVYSPDESTKFDSSVYVDWSQLNMAELKYSGSQYYYKEYSSLALICSPGDGAVGILPYALSELGRLSASDYRYCVQKAFVHRILEDVSQQSNERYRGSYSYKYYINDYIPILYAMLTGVGNSSVILNLGVLKFIIIVYVIIAGPILYMILRSIKKRELYWAAVPMTALVGVFLVFFAGRGFEVASTRVYSVTAYNLAERRDCKTYLYCYDAGHREWSLRLAEGYEYAGPQISNSMYDDTYYYHIRKDGDRMLFGINPSSGFEDSYFCAGRVVDKEEAGGSIDSTGERWLANTETVTNNTSYDFAYFAVVEDDYVQVYKRLHAGETSSLTNDEMVFSVSLGDYYYFEEYLSNVKEYVKTENRGAVSALGVGISLVEPKMSTGKTAIIGVVEDWDKAVDDNCSETSYGCFYIIQ